MTRSHSSRDISVNCLSAVIPALFTSTSGRAERLVTDLDHVFDLGAIGDVGPGRDGRPARRFDRIDGVVCRPFR